MENEKKDVLGCDFGATVGAFIIAFAFIAALGFYAVQFITWLVAEIVEVFG